MSVRQIRARALGVLATLATDVRPVWTNEDAQAVIWLANLADSERDNTRRLVKLLTPEQRKAYWADALGVPIDEVPDGALYIGIAAPSDADFERAVELSKERGWKDIQP